MQALCWALAATLAIGLLYGLSAARGTQRVDYAVLEQKYSRAETGMPGYSGYTDKARFIFHMGSTAYLFGEHEGRTLVTEFITSGFLLRFRLLQTDALPKPSGRSNFVPVTTSGSRPSCGAYSEYAPPGCELPKGHDGPHMGADG